MFNQYVLSFFLVRSGSIFNTLNKIPYTEITNTNNAPKNIFVLNIAKIFRAFDNFKEKTCVTLTVTIKKTANASNENSPMDDDIITNHTVDPIVTANALYLGDDSFILNRIN